jgi:hypothetical protein
VKHAARHPLIPLVGAYARPWLIGGALVLQPLLLAAAALWVPALAAWIAVPGLAVLFGIVLWAGPLCSLLVDRRHRRELALPALPRGLQRQAWALLLGINFVAPALAIAAAAPDGEDARLGVALLACLQMLIAAFMLMPSWVFWLPLVGFLAASVLPAGSAPVRLALDALHALPPGAAFAAAALVLAGMTAWRARRFVQGSRPLGVHSSILEWQLRMGRATGIDAMLATGRGKPSRWLVARAHGAAGDSAGRRMAQLLGPPFTPGSTRRQLAFVMLPMALVSLWLSPMASSMSGVDTAGVNGTLPWLYVGAVIGFSAPFSQRLARLFRADRPELAELALLPGLGTGAAQRRRRLGGVIAWRSLRCWAAATALGMLWLGWLHSPAWLAPLGAFAGLALLWLNAARYLRRGRGLLPGELSGTLADGIATSAGVAALVITGDGPAALPVLLVLAVLVLFAGLRLRAAA